MDSHIQETNCMKHKPSQNLLLQLAGLFLAALLLAGVSIAGKTEQAAVKIMQKEKLGKFLAAGNGMTLYTYARDEDNTSNCVEGCAANWPPFHADPSAEIEGCDTDDFMIMTRSDGKLQTTYKRMPLYYFKNDKYPGDTFGHGIGDVWFIVKP